MAFKYYLDWSSEKNICSFHTTADLEKKHTRGHCVQRFWARQVFLVQYKEKDWIPVSGDEASWKECVTL